MCFMRIGGIEMLNKAGYLRVGDIKKALENVPDNMPVFVHNTVNPCGNVSELGKIEEDVYSSFGEINSCLILKSVLLVQDELE